MLKGFTHARLACGCRLAFREGVEGSPVTVVIDAKAPGCVISLHVQQLPIYDFREAYAHRPGSFRSKKKSSKRKANEGQRAKVKGQKSGTRYGRSIRGGRFRLPDRRR